LNNLATQKVWTADDSSGSDSEILEVSNSRREYPRKRTRTVIASPSRPWDNNISEVSWITQRDAAASSTKLEKISDLSFDARSLYLLAAPSTPNELMPEDVPDVRLAGPVQTCQILVKPCQAASRRTPSSARWKQGSLKLKGKLR
jgi:hypothetical protein